MVVGVAGGKLPGHLGNRVISQIVVLFTYFYLLHLLGHPERALLRDKVLTHAELLLRPTHFPPTDTVS